ncbi:MAG: hypothetical protein ACHQ4H_18405, partial [Ktedonobacterales bacterium]
RSMLSWEKEGANMTQTHVLVFCDEPGIAGLFACVCEDEGYLTSVTDTVDDTLTVLRTSLHPLIVIAERDHSSSHPDGPFFQTIHDHPDLYGRHRYIATHAWEIAKAERQMLDAMGVRVFGVPFPIEQLTRAVDALAEELA